MENNHIKKNLYLRNLSFSLKKKFLHHKKTSNMTSLLKNLFTNKYLYNHRNLSLFLFNSMFLENLQRQSFSIIHTICFSFSPVNTFLYVLDSLGRLKFKYSAGFLGFKGKQKKNRLKILYSFLKELRKLRVSVLRNKPISLIFNNVDFYKYFLVKKLKNFFYITLLKNYQIQPYNGCRKKKRLRKK